MHDLYLIIFMLKNRISLRPCVVGKVIAVIIFDKNKEETSDNIGHSYTNEYVKSVR